MVTVRAASGAAEVIMRTGFSAVWAAVVLVGCSHKVSVGWLESADVDLGSDVHQILVVDRVGPGNAGESVIDAAEALLTGEGLDGDRDTAEQALRGLVAILEQTERYDVTVLVDGKAADPAIFGGTMDERAIAKLCKKHDCDAIVALDALDTDSATSVVRTRDATGPSVEATSTTQLSATFRTYDADGTLLDSQSVRSAAEDSNEDDTAVGAVSGVVDPWALQQELAWEAGLIYGQRIAPHEVLDQRRLYATGSPELKAAMKHVRSGDWDGATAIWKEVRASGSAKDAAKAQYNLAVAREVHGNLDRALALATKASVQLDSPRSRTYVADLSARIDDLERLSKQLPTANPTTTTRG